jgi:hypothetical protein
VGLVRIYVEAGAAALHSPTWSFEVPLLPPGPRLRATSRPPARPRGWGRPPPRRHGSRPFAKPPPRGGPADWPSSPPGLGPSVVEKRRWVGRREREPATGQAKMVAATPPGECARPAAGGGKPVVCRAGPAGGAAARGGRRGAAWRRRGRAGPGRAGLGPLAADVWQALSLSRSHAGRRRAGGGGGGGGGGAAAAPGPGAGRARAGRRAGGRAAHTMALGEATREARVPPRALGAGGPRGLRAGKVSPGGES